MEQLFSNEELLETIKRSKLKVSLEEILSYWNKKGWRTLKGTLVSNSSVAASVVNGFYVEREIKIAKKKKIKELKKPKKKTYEPYKDQLKRKEWLSFRKFIMDVRGSKCEVCGNDKHINIHHLKYISKKKAWEYTCEDVLVLCNDCHMKVHGIEKHKS